MGSLFLCRHGDLGSDRRTWAGLAGDASGQKGHQRPTYALPGAPRGFEGSRPAAAPTLGAHSSHSLEGWPWLDALPSWEQACVRGPAQDMSHLGPWGPSRRWGPGPEPSLPPITWRSISGGRPAIQTASTLVPAASAWTEWGEVGPARKALQSRGGLCWVMHGGEGGSGQ